MPRGDAPRSSKDLPLIRATERCEECFGAAGDFHVMPCVSAMAARIKVLDGHRNKWRTTAFRLLEVLEAVDSWADPPESVAERVREAKALFEERSGSDSESETKGERR